MNPSAGSPCIDLTAASQHSLLLGEDEDDATCGDGHDVTYCRYPGPQQRPEGAIPGRRLSARGEHSQAWQQGARNTPHTVTGMTHTLVQMQGPAIGVAECCSLDASSLIGLHHHECWCELIHCPPAGSQRSDCKLDQLATRSRCAEGLGDH